MWPLGGNDHNRVTRTKEPSYPHCPRGNLTIQRSHRLVSLAVRRVTLAGAMSGGAWRVWIFLEGWLGGLVPTMFTWRIRKLGWGKGVSKVMRAGPQGQSLSRSGQPPHPAVPVVGEGIEFGHLHGAGVGLVGELVNQQPLLPLPNHAYLEKGDTLRPARLVGLRCSVPQVLGDEALPMESLDFTPGLTWRAPSGVTTFAGPET